MVKIDKYMESKYGAKRTNGFRVVTIDTRYDRFALALYVAEPNRKFLVCTEPDDAAYGYVAVYELAEFVDLPED